MTLIHGVDWDAAAFALWSYAADNDIPFGQCDDYFPTVGGNNLWDFIVVPELYGPSASVSLVGTALAPYGWTTTDTGTYFHVIQGGWPIVSAGTDFNIIGPPIADVTGMTSVSGVGSFLYDPSTSGVTDAWAPRGDMSIRTCDPVTGDVMTVGACGFTIDGAGTSHPVGPYPPWPGAIYWDVFGPGGDVIATYRIYEAPAYNPSDVFYTDAYLTGPAVKITNGGYDQAFIYQAPCSGFRLRMVMPDPGYWTNPIGYHLIALYSTTILPQPPRYLRQRQSPRGNPTRVSWKTL